MQIFSKMDIGLLRKSNQDAFFTGRLTENTALLIVCDGMGGANAGNVASQTAVKQISEYIGKAYRPLMDDIALADLIKNAVISANINIYDVSLTNEEYAGMGTTAVVAVVSKNRCVISNVGDSRAYILNDDIKQITKDHSVVQSLIESGKLTPDEAKVYPRKNVITRALGVEENVIADVDSFDLSEGDTLLLCTDGLTNFVDAKEILNAYKTTDINNLANLLVDTANRNGGGDNVTVVTLTV